MLIPETVLEMIWGTRQPWTLTCVTPVTNLPVDISGYDLIMTVKMQTTDPDPGVFQLTNIGGVANGIVKTNPTGGIAIATVLPAQTMQQVQREMSCRWDLRLTATLDPTNSQIIARGAFLIHPAVSSQTDV